jgi:hypothetical protein
MYPQASKSNRPPRSILSKRCTNDIHREAGIYPVERERISRSIYLVPGESHSEGDQFDRHAAFCKCSAKVHKQLALDTSHLDVTRRKIENFDFPHLT